MICQRAQVHPDQTSLFPDIKAEDYDEKTVIYSNNERP